MTYRFLCMVAAVAFALSAVNGAWRYVAACGGLGALCAILTVADAIIGLRVSIRVERRDD